jgi:hypothetical protein
MRRKNRNTPLQSAEVKQKKGTTNYGFKMTKKLTLGDFGTTIRLLDDNVPTYTRHVSKPR